MQVNIRLDHELLAVETEHQVHAMLELLAPSAPEDSQRPPLHLALVIDRSGSMAGGKLAAAKASAAYLINQLQPTDELAIVAFDDEVNLVAPLVPVDPARHLAALDQVHEGGSTNLSGGWLKGAEVLRCAVIGGTRRVLLLSDGEANHGIVDHAQLESLSRSTLEATGVSTSTIGFGDGFDEDLMTLMADAGQGNAHFAPTPDDAAAIFAQEFEDLSTLVAQNVSVEIRPGQHVQLTRFLNDYPATEVPGGVQLALGDAYAGTRRRVVFELQIPGLGALGPVQVGELVLRYVTVGDEVAAHEVKLPITVNLVSADEAAAVAPDAEVTDEVVILLAAQAQEQARLKADEGDFEAAQQLLSQAAEELRKRAPGSPRADELLEQSRLWTHQSGLMSEVLYDQMAVKQMKYTNRASRRPRPKGDA